MYGKKIYLLPVLTLLLGPENPCSIHMLHYDPLLVIGIPWTVEVVLCFSFHVVVSCVICVTCVDVSGVWYSHSY